MSVILLADDSPHAQRMGERILSGEGYQVVWVGDGEAAALRLPEIDPDVVIADANLPGLSGIELCRYIKSSCRHVRVILTAGQIEEMDESAARRAGCDAILRKPFEASVMLDTLRPAGAEGASRGARQRRPAATSAHRRHSRRRRTRRGTRTAAFSRRTHSESINGLGPLVYAR